MAPPGYPQNGLVIFFQGREVKRLRPGDPAYTFGRGADRDLRFGHDVLGGQPDRDIARNAGSLRWNSGIWLVSNDSRSRPFDVVVRGVANPLPPRTSPDTLSVWAVSPPDLEINVVAPSGPYVLKAKLHRGIPRHPTSRDSKVGPSTPVLPRPTEIDRLILAAKFLSLQDPGDAIGNAEAAEWANLARRREKPFTDNAIGSCVARWCKVLQEHGVTGISNRENINQLGRQLIAYSILRQEDRALLRPAE